MDWNQIITLGAALLGGSGIGAAIGTGISWRLAPKSQKRKGEADADTQEQTAVGLEISNIKEMLALYRGESEGLLSRVRSAESSARAASKSADEAIRVVRLYDLHVDDWNQAADQEPDKGRRIRGRLVTQRPVFRPAYTKEG